MAAKPADNRIKAVTGGQSLAVDGVRYNIPEPDDQDGKTCWYYSARNMLKGWGLDDSKGGTDLKKINPRDKKFEGKDREGLFNELLREAEFSFQKVNLVGFGHVCDLLKEGPFMISLTKHPKASQATLWDARVLGTPLGESADNVLTRVPYELEGMVPHMMVVVGFVKRKYNELTKQVRDAEGIPEGLKKVISEIANKGGFTNEMLLLDPNQPKMSPEFGKRNDVLLCDWHALSAKIQGEGNIRRAFRVVMKK